MSWMDPQFEAIAKQDLKRMLKANTTEDKPVKDALNLLKGAKNKGQAQAVLRNVTTFNQLKLLASTNYAGIANNSDQAVKAALAQAPQVAQQATAQAQAIQQDNQRINGYLQTVISNDFNAHRGGTFNKQLPLQDMVSNQLTVIARHYNNTPPKLPPGGHYIEWYPLVGGTRSPQKRFFTRRSNQTDLWYTEGGTHGAGLWWQQSAPGGDWIAF
jgi:hypothetical protein